MSGELVPFHIRGLIDSKYSELKNKVNFGTPLGDIKNVGYGGFVHEYQYGAIYYHQLMGTRAHAVWGAIYDKYISLGGHGENSETKTRLFGFPITDEMDDKKNSRVSKFEWGAIYWIHGGSVSGEIYRTWKEMGRELSPAGYPVSDLITFNDVDFIFFENALMVKIPTLNKPFMATIDYPLLGNPKIVSPSNAENLLTITFTLESNYFALLMTYISTHPRFLEEIFVGKFYCSEVVRSGVVARKVDLDLIKITPTIVSGRLGFSINIGTSSGRLSDRKLYNICLKRPTGDYCYSFHSVYAKNSWDNFGLVHATDIHVSRRLEYAKHELEELHLTDPDSVSSETPSKFNNFNDNFRELIKYINFLYDKGEVDCIIATGDIVDYVYDDDLHTARGYRSLKDVLLSRKKVDNFLFFERLIRGLETSQNGTKNEELRVPIFTSLGNHDYRVVQFPWIFTVDVPFVSDKEMRHYEPINLLEKEALALEGGMHTISADRGISMIKPNSHPYYYFEHINRPSGIAAFDGPNKGPKFESQYTVNLGPHRIVMLDSRWDIGRIESKGDAVGVWWGGGTDDEDQFMTGGPNSAGVDDIGLQLVKTALNEAGSIGIVIVGIHAPLMEFTSGFYPDYLRETQHPTANVSEVKRGFPNFTNFQLYQKGSDGDGINENWPETGTPYFKFGGVDVTLGGGVSKGNNFEFLKLCSGKDSPRKVDLILSGHGHRNVEFRTEYLEGKKILFYHDYYTENPKEYYPIKLLSPMEYDNYRDELNELNHILSSYPYEQWQSMYYHVANLVSKYKGKMKSHRIIINQQPGVAIDHRDNANRNVPPYSDPLDKSTNPINWWNRHKPLFIQTAAVGPMETNQSTKEKRASEGISFQGCRMITIKNNVITKIKMITMKHIRAFNIKSSVDRRRGMSDRSHTTETSSRTSSHS